MQVTHERDHVTHAVIGGKKTIDFGISDSPEFFNILSSTLYKDQMLAVVREVLCNAWDAHIDADITDRPVEVTFKNDMLIVRDFGKGIHQDLIGPIYGTYGGSTKKNDGKQTGGFGLGCKAPFAYTDHFEVTSWHEGVMTIYAMSKSSAEVSGKPGITPIVSAPTQSTGLQVSIKMKSYDDQQRFQSLVKKIAFNGDILVTLDGAILPKLNFGSDNFFLITTGYASTNMIHVRYGNVIYPVDCADDIRARFQRVQEVVRRITNTSHNAFTIIFQAPPHSIAVTPSRESLSMQEHTCQTLNTLFQQFLVMYDKEFENLLIQQTKNIYTTLPATTDTDIILARNLAPVGGQRSVESTFPIQKNIFDNIRTLSDAAKLHLEVTYPSNWTYRKLDIEQRIAFLLRHNMVNKQLALSYLKELGHIKAYEHIRFDRKRSIQQENLPNHNWIQKQIIRPLATKALATKEIELERLFVSDTYAGLSKKEFYTERRYLEMPGFVPVKKAIFTHMPAMMPYLRNIVVLAYSRLRVTQETKISDSTGNTVLVGSGFFVYIVNRRKNDLANARKFFTDRGMTIIDYTEQEEVQRKTEYKPINKPRRKGLPALSAIYSEKDNNIDLDRLKQADLSYIEDPKFYLRVHVRQDSMNRIEGFRRNYWRTLFKHYGALGGVVTTTRQEESYIKQGIPDLATYLMGDITTHLIDNKKIFDYWTLNPERILQKSEDHRQLVQFILNSPYLAQHFNLLHTLPDQDKEYIELFHMALQNFPYSKNKEPLSKIFETLEATPLHPAAIDLINKINSSTVVKFLDVSELEHTVRIASTDQKKQEVCDVFLKLLNL